MRGPSTISARSWWARAIVASMVVLAVGALTVTPGAAALASRGIPGSTVTAQIVHRDSGAPGPDAVTSFGTASAAVAGTSLPGLSAGLVGVASTPDGGGYWLVASDGGVFAFGDARYSGSLGGSQLDAPIVGIAATLDGAGYWLVASDGGVFALGDAAFLGSLGGERLNAPIVGMTVDPHGAGYYLVASDGGVFAFGAAPFSGSLGGTRLNEPIVGMAASADGGGYWLVASDGGVFAFGEASFAGSLGAAPLDAPIVGMATNPGGPGYWLLAADGGVFAFGAAPFLGSDGGAAVGAPAVGIAGRAGGYWVTYGLDRSAAMIPAIAAYAAGRADNITVAVEDRLTGRIWQYRPGVVEHTASTLKVDILATLLTQTQAAGRGLTSSEQALAVPMIEDSLDSAANSLWGRLGPAAVAGFERAAGMTSTVPATNGVWGATTTTALDRLAMLGALVEPNGLLTDASRAYVLGLMEHINPTQDWGATGGVSPRVTVALKNGFAIINGWQINTTGWVNGDGRDYLIAVLTDGSTSESYGIATVDAISSIVWQSLGP